MEIRDLNEDEQLALVGLIEFIAESNATISEEEEEEISGLVAEFGAEKYRSLVDAVDEKFGNEEALRAFLTGIERQEARDLIYGLGLETALSDAENLAHSDMLDWLRAEWNVSVEIGSA